MQEWQAAMDPLEFAEWGAFFELEPSGAMFFEVWMRRLSALIWNVFFPKHQREPKSFALFYKPERKPQTAEEMWANAQMYFGAMKKNE